MNHTNTAVLSVALGLSASLAACGGAISGEGSDSDGASVTDRSEALKSCPPGSSLDCEHEGLGGKLLCACAPDVITPPPPPPPVPTPIEVVAGGSQVCALVKDATGTDQSVRCTVFAIYQNANLYGSYLGGVGATPLDDGQVPGNGSNVQIQFTN